MTEAWIPYLVSLAVTLGTGLAYAIGRTVQRKKRSAVLRAPRPWQPGTLSAWAERGWIDAECLATFPRELSIARVLFEWARTDPEVAAHWSLRQPLLPDTPFEAVVRELWSRLPAEIAAAGRSRLVEELSRAGSAWGGAEQGWNGRPLALLATAVGKRKSPIPLLPMEDLTAAPLPPLPQADRFAAEADGPDLILALAAVRRVRFRFVHPLAPRQGAQESLVAGLSTQIGTDVGRRIGAGLGAVLGPIGSLVGQHLGGLVGGMGGRALAQKSLPEPLSEALGATENALSHLGELARGPAFLAAAQDPIESLLEAGRRVEARRASRAGRLRERIWPTAGLACADEAMWVAVGELKGLRAATEQFAAAAQKAEPAVAGGMILQNPWLVRTLPGGVERLNEARAALNRAARWVRSQPADPDS